MEKGGIIKPGTPVVVSPQAPEAMSELMAIAGRRDAPLVVIGRDWDYAPAGSVAPSGPLANQWMVITQAPPGALIPAGTALELSLAGRYQQENAAVAVAALDQVRSLFPSLTADTVRRGLANVAWPGRLQTLAYGQGGPALLVDCAHNVDSARKLADALTLDYRYQKLWLVLGITADKDLRGILRTLLPLASHVIVTASGHPRAATPEELQALAAELGFETLVSHSVSEAVQIAWSAAGPDDLICVAGSIFVVGDLLNHWESLQSTLQRGAVSEPS
jgi:dihydrofolate synthase/folylpolyglutamate synthase